MPHWDEQGREEWVCQRGAHVCTGVSVWAEGALQRAIGCCGNVCLGCLASWVSSVAYASGVLTAYKANPTELDRLGVLADAMEDAGCEDATLLAALRQAAG